MNWLLVCFVLVTVLCIIGGAHLIVKSKVKDDLLSVMVSVSSGIILSLTFVEFLPKAFRHGTEYTPYLILLGIVSFIVSDKYITPRLKFFNSGPSCEKTGCKTHDPKQLLTSQTACSSISCLVVCAFFDGFELSTALKLGPSTGLFMAAALFMHLAPTGALAASLSLAGKLGSKNAIKSSQIVTVSLVLGITASLVIGQISGFYEYLLPITTGILLYNLLVHLIPSALKFRWGVIVFMSSAMVTSFLISAHH